MTTRPTTTAHHRENPADEADITASFSLAALPAGFHDDPYPVYRALRTRTPVKALPEGGYFLTRYEDCLKVYRDTKVFSSDKKVEFKPKYGDSLLYEHHTTSLVFNDPPLHTRVRRLMAGALTPRAISSMEAGLIELVDSLLDAMEQTMADQGHVDLIEDFAAAIPVEIIGNLLGVPRGERGPLRDWSLAILGALEPVLTREQFEQGETSVREFLAYLKGLVAERRRNPGDPATDVLTRLILGEQSGERLTEEELLHNCVFLLNAGHETTTNLIGNALVALVEWPDQKQRLLDHPDLIKTAIEEVLRFESSNQLGNRITTEATNVGGVDLPAGSRLTLCIGAANRDPDAFPDPETFDVGRTPNRHLAFAMGPHQCAGMNLARLEGRISVGRFLARFPRYRLTEPPVRGGRVRFRGFLSIPASLS